MCVNYVGLSGASCNVVDMLLYKIMMVVCAPEPSMFVLISVMNDSDCCVSIDKLSIAAVSAWKIVDCVI